MENSSTVKMLRERSDNLTRSILTLTNELRNVNKEINNTIEANDAAAVQHSDAIEQIYVDNEALAALHEENVQAIQDIETVVKEALNDNVTA